MSSFYWHKTPALLSRIFPNFIWHKSRNEKVLYLTFDDGPIPDITEFVLHELEEFGAKATFFCVGENIDRNPNLFQKIIDLGHAIGNHTYNHLNARKVNPIDFLQNISMCETAINKRGYYRLQKIFRPPYGMMRKRLTPDIRKNYSVVMWDVLTGDFDNDLSPEKCLHSTLNATENGSIIVFHDSLKSGKKLKFVLPRFLSHFKEKGYKFQAI